jgi:hypothetical protein
MTDTKNERGKPIFSASTILAALGDALAAIKRDDGLSYDDLGAVLGVSPDQAAKYCAGEATMNAVTQARGKREWNGRFTGALDRLCVESRPGGMTDHAKSMSVLKAALALSQAMESGNIDEIDIRQNRATLENARDSLTELLGKLGPKEAVA